MNESQTSLTPQQRSIALVAFAFAIAVCWLAAGGMFWLLSRPPVELGPFTSVSPEAARFGEPFLLIRSIAFGLGIIGLALFFGALYFHRRFAATP